jgi:hypothetical protein
LIKLYKYKLKNPDEIICIENLNVPLNPLIIYLHSIKKFLYKSINKADRDNDKSVIDNLVPYVKVLSNILKYS